MMEGESKDAIISSGESGKNNSEKEASGDMVAVALATPPSKTAAEASGSDDITETAKIATTTATSNDDDDVDALLDELDDDAQRVETSVETSHALERLRESTSRLGSALSFVTRDLDTKLGISSSLQNLDEQIHASQAIQDSSEVFGQSLSSTIDSLWTSYGLDEKVTKPLQQTLESTTSTELPIAPGETKKLGDAVAEGAAQINDTFLKMGWSLKRIDESHKITASTASTLAMGADFLARSVLGTSDDIGGVDGSDLIAEGTTVITNDDVTEPLPSSTPTAPTATTEPTEESSKETEKK